MQCWHHQFKSSDWARKLESKTWFRSILPCKWGNMTGLKSASECRPSHPFFFFILNEYIQREKILQAHPGQLGKWRFEYWPWSCRLSGNQCFIIITISSNHMKAKTSPNLKITYLYGGIVPSPAWQHQTDEQAVFELSDARPSLSAPLLTLQLCLYFEKGQNTDAS